MCYDLTGLLNPTRDVDGNLDASDRYLAVHEAGHALVAEALRRRVKHVTIDCNLGNPGVQLFDMQANPEQCPIHFGGYLAIERAVGATKEPPLMHDAGHDGCQIDVQNASNCAGNYWRGLPEHEELSSPEVDKLRLRYCVASQTFAWGLVIYHWANLLSLAKVLEVERNMDGDRCRKLLNLVQLS